MGEARITDSELVSGLPAKIGEAGVRILLKERGCPLQGTFYPDLMPGYEYTVERLATDHAMIVKWRKVTNG